MSTFAETLDRVASGLEATFAALMGVRRRPPLGVEVWATQAGSWAFPLGAIVTRGSSVEPWKWKLVPGDRYDSPGNPGVAGIDPQRACW